MDWSVIDLYARLIISGETIRTIIIIYHDELSRARWETILYDKSYVFYEAF